MINYSRCITYIGIIAGLLPQSPAWAQGVPQHRLTPIEFAADFHDSSWSSQQGQGRINGVDTPIKVLTGMDRDKAQLANNLVKYFTGHYSVLTETTPWSTMIVAIDLQSAQCRSCTKPTKANLSDIVHNAYIVSLIGLPDNGGGLAIGAGLGGFVDLPANCRQEYEGGVFHKLASKLQICTQATYLFNTSALHMLTAETTEPAAQLYRLMVTNLAGQGYLPLGKNSDLDRPEFNGQGSAQAFRVPLALGKQSKTWAGVWAKDAKVVQVSINDDPHKGKTTVMVNEEAVQLSAGRPIARGD